MKRIICFLLCAAMMLAVLAGCSGDDAYVPTGDGLSWEDGSSVIQQPTTPEKEQELVLAYYPDESMNPLQSTDFTNRTLFSLIYQGLFAVDSDYVAHPVLCKSFSVSDDMRTYTFYVADATFSDGTPLTVQDVYASLKYALESPVYGGRFHDHVQSMNLSYDGGIVFKLDTAYENFPLLLDIPIVKQSELEAPVPLGTGPYAFENSLAGARLRKLNNWWCVADLPLNSSSIELVVGESPAHIRDQFEFYDVTLVCADPCSDSYADYRSDYELWDCENGIFLYIGCNANNSDIFTNETVRAALTYAIDRNRLVDEYYQGFARSTTLACSPLAPYYSQPLASKYEYDPQRFTDALYSTGFNGYNITFLVNKDDTLRLRVARTIRDMLVECGLVVTMKEVGGADYTYAVRASKYDIYLGQTKLPPNMDLSEFFYEYGNLHYGGLTDAVLYNLCLNALANSGNYYNLHKEVADDGRVTSVLFQSYAIYADRGLLNDLSPSRDNVFFYSLGKQLWDLQIDHVDPVLIPEETTPE